MMEMSFGANQRNVLIAGSYNVGEAGSIQHDLQERLRRCRGKQGQVFTSAGRMSPGLKGVFAQLS